MNVFNYKIPLLGLLSLGAESSCAQKGMIFPFSFHKFHNEPLAFGLIMNHIKQVLVWTNWIPFVTLPDGHPLCVYWDNCIVSHNTDMEQLGFCRSFQPFALISFSSKNILSYLLCLFTHIMLFPVYLLTIIHHRHSRFTLYI